MVSTSDENTDLVWPLRYVFTVLSTLDCTLHTCVMNTVICENKWHNKSLTTTIYNSAVIMFDSRGKNQINSNINVCLHVIFSLYVTSVTYTYVHAIMCSLSKYFSTHSKYELIYCLR